MLWMALISISKSPETHRTAHEHTPTCASVFVGHRLTCKAAVLAVGYVVARGRNTTEQNRTSAIIPQRVSLRERGDREAQPAELGLSLCGM